MRHLAVALLFSLGLAAHASTIVNFDSQALGAGAPSGFDGGTDSPLTIGIAKFTGGELLLGETGGPDQTGVYATYSLSLIGGGYKNPLGIAFSQAVSGFSLLLTNNLAATFIVSDNLGGSQSLTLAQNASQIFTLTDNGITSVNIVQVGSLFDYAIDNVTFSPAVTAVPEPSSFVMLGTGLFSSVAFLRRKRLGSK